MQVVRYLHHSDLLLEDEHGVVIIAGSRYVLSVGDKVFLKKVLEQEKSCIRWIFPLPAIITARCVKMNAW